ncbi:MAG TPA: transposase [Pseudomonas xinjiangensis]|uniref:Transposase n=2 Tax=root TaxID=1 RepID=A0A7V1BME2_9GAMM|nr:transposase [Halopseudomonas xinjiangensis]HEC46144.1 transposase [Halopseudomonas xinjiangensis]
MPRLGRIVLPNYPHHIVQRGHNRQVVFACADNFQRYLSDIRELKEVFHIRLYAWCLMTNHVHLLVCPETTAGLGQFMKSLAGRATRYRNRLEGRSGTLWEGRYKSSVVDSETYLLACCRYIELNPVRAKMVARAQDYPWSSFVSRMQLRPGDDLVDGHPCYDILAPTEFERRELYGQFVGAGIPDNELRLIQEAVSRCQLTGGARFVDEIEKITGSRLEFRSQGRPKKSKS